jgi:hypothetical protein
MNQEERVKELKEDLYYDILDKYVQVLADNKKLVAKDKIRTNRMLFYKRLDEQDYNESKNEYNKMIQDIIKIIKENKTDYEKSVNEIKYLSYNKLNINQKDLNIKL